MFYVDYISKRAGNKLNCGFPLLPINEQNEKLKIKIERILSGLEGITVIPRETGDYQNLHLGVTIEMDKLTEQNLIAIANVALLYAEGFGKK